MIQSQDIAHLRCSGSSWTALGLSVAHRHVLFEFTYLNKWNQALSVNHIMSNIAGFWQNNCTNHSQYGYFSLEKVSADFYGDSSKHCFTSYTVFSTILGQVGNGGSGWRFMTTKFPLKHPTFLERIHHPIHMHYIHILRNGVGHLVPIQYVTLYRLWSVAQATKPHLGRRHYCKLMHVASLVMTKICFECVPLSYVHLVPRYST